MTRQSITGDFGPTTSLAVLDILPEGRTREKSRGYMICLVPQELQSSKRKPKTVLLHNMG